MAEYSEVTNQECEIAFLRVPAHVGVVCNETVGRLAKEATAKETIETSIMFSTVDGKEM